MLTQNDMPEGYVLEIGDLQRIKIRDQYLPELEIDGYLKDGELRFEIVAILKQTGQRSVVRGKTLFALMMQHYQRVETLVGIWADGNNLDEFNRQIALGKGLEEAVAETWTGQQAARYGLTVMKIDEALGSRDGYGWVRAFFRRPEGGT